MLCGAKSDIAHEIFDKNRIFIGPLGHDFLIRTLEQAVKFAAGTGFNHLNEILDPHGMPVANGEGDVPPLVVRTMNADGFGTRAQGGDGNNYHDDHVKNSINKIRLEADVVVDEPLRAGGRCGFFHKIREFEFQMSCFGIEALTQGLQNSTQTLHLQDRPLRIEHLDETTHVRALVMVRQINGKLNHGHGALLAALVTVAHTDRVTQIFHPDPVDGELPVIRLALRVMKMGFFRFVHTRYFTTRACLANENFSLSVRACHVFNPAVMGHLFELNEEVAVVIGATGVLGGAMAEALASAGASVVVAGRNAERGAERVEAIEQSGGKAAFIPVDAANKTSLEKALAETVEKLGPPTLLVNAAGGNSPSVTVTGEHPFSQISKADWVESFDLNLVGGALLPCQVFGEAMIKAGRGSIINIASVSAHLPLSRVVAYSAAKAAVLNLTQFLAREWAPHNIRVNSITPGFFPAEQNRRLLFQEDGTPTPRAQAILGHTPMNRFGTAGELAGAVIFLASSRASSFVTGTDIRVDGGYLSQTI